jgi:uncharacterized protein YcsI (UPF0317 family)
MLSAAELVSRSVHSHDADLPSRDARLTYRSGIVDVTSGVAPGYVQGNLAIVPESLAASFHRFCQLNPKPCPIIGMSESAIRAFQHSASISISGPTFLAIGSGATAN